MEELLMKVNQYNRPLMLAFLLNLWKTTVSAKVIDRAVREGVECGHFEYLFVDKLELKHDSFFVSTKLMSPSVVDRAIATSALLPAYKQKLQLLKNIRQLISNDLPKNVRDLFRVPEWSSTVTFRTEAFAYLLSILFGVGEPARLFAELRKSSLYVSGQILRSVFVLLNGL